MSRAASCRLLRFEKPFADLLRTASGSVAVENAFVLPVFLLFIFTIVSAGFLCWTQMSLQSSVEAAARCAAISTSTCGTPAAIKNYAASQVYALSIPASDFTVSAPGCGHEVSASYPFHVGLPYVHSQTITLTAQSCHP